MHRRSILRGAVVASIPLFAGCQNTASSITGKNETLEIQNKYVEPVELHITVEKGKGPEEEREVVFDETVEVPANETVTRDVLGDAQYYLTVRWGDKSHRFGTRPICDPAFTTISVTEDGELTSQIQDCE